MHIFFSGIGGTGIGPLALVAKQAGYEVSGSDKQDSLYIAYLRKNDIDDITIGQKLDDIDRVHAKRPVDWYVYSSAVAIEQPDSPEMRFCSEHKIRISKRDELLNEILLQKKLKLVAIAGTHGKTTTTAMIVWAFLQLGIPVSYILPAKSSFAEMGRYVPDSKYFVYECDEFDRNFLHYRPSISVITGIAWDHPDIYPSPEEYNQAFRDFMAQSDTVISWQSDLDRLGSQPEAADIVLEDSAEQIKRIRLAGEVNRRDAWLVANSLARLLKKDVAELISVLEKFPGVARRFEQIYPGLYSDYAHTPEKIRGALQLGREIAGDKLVIVYEGLHNTRQHFIRNQLVDLFTDVKQLYVAPSYLARENTSLENLTPEKLISGMNNDVKKNAEPVALDNHLRQSLQTHLDSGDTVLCLSAGGGGSLDEWLRSEFV